MVRAGLLIAENKAALHKYFPGFNWTYLKMHSDTYFVRQQVTRLIKQLREENPQINPITVVAFL